MQKTLISVITSFCIAIMFIRCGYQLSKNEIPSIMNSKQHIPCISILLHSDDPFNSIIRLITNELSTYQIKVINHSDLVCMQNHQHNILYWNILNISKKHIHTAVYQDGTESEYQLMLTIQTKLSSSNKKNYYPININLCRTFIKNPDIILSDIVQENEILEDMYRDAAQKLVQNLLTYLKE